MSTINPFSPYEKTIVDKVLNSFFGGEMNLSSLIDRKGGFTSINVRAKYKIKDLGMLKKMLNCRLGFIPKIEVKDMYTICLYKTM